MKKTGTAAVKKQIQPPERRRKEIVFTRSSGTYGLYGYQAASTATAEGRSYPAASGQRHELYDRIKLINQSRAFMRDNAIYSGMIKRAVSYIVGNGFTLQVKTDDPKLNSEIEAMWKQEHRKPEITQLLTGPRTDRMICREIMTAGDILILLTNQDSKIQLIEAEQFAGRTPATREGILKDKYGRAKKFFVCPYNANGFIKTENPAEYEPENVLFLTNPERPSSTRGVPPCQASFPMLHRINDVCDSEAIAWQLLARLAVSITQKEGAQQNYLNSKADPNLSTAETEGKLATRVTELGYALIFRGEIGEEINGVERNIPGKNFAESLRMFLRLLGLPIGLPLELILLDWTQSNYSQSRAVLEQAYQMFLDYQQMLEDFYYRPLVKWRTEQKIKNKQLEENDYDFNFDFIKPTFPWIDQLKEVQAYGAKVDRGFATHTQVCKSLNTDRDEVVSQRVKEITDAIAKAKQIEKDTGEKVPWQILAGMETPGQRKAVLDTSDEPPAKTGKQKDENNGGGGDTQND